MNSDEIKFQQRPEDKDKQISFEIGYIVPFWSSKPIHKYTLDVWREGVIIDTIDISQKEYYIVGRNKNICDIYSNNMTISRIHCVIQHKDDGDVFLYDLDSVYGTFINKRPIAKKTYVKLNVGDTFKLGQSNKMFILNGPAPQEEENDIQESEHADTIAKPADHPLKYVDKREIMEKRVRMVKELYDQRENYKKNVLGTEKDYVDWGQRDYDEDIMEHQREEEELYSNDKNKLSNEDLEGTLNLEELKERKDLSDKQRNNIDKLENMAKGIKKIKEEITKLRKKEMDQGELTEGQKKRIEIDEKKLIDLFEKYETQENNLRVSLTSKDEFEGLVEQKFDRKFAKELDSDNDEFFDRVGTKKDINLNSENIPVVITENYESLKQKLENMIRNRQRLIDKLQKVDSEKDKTNMEEIDSLDLYFMETQNQIKTDTKGSLTNQINDTTREIAKTQKLLSLVTPSHIKIKFKADEEVHKHSHVNITPQVPQPEDKSISKKKKTEGILDMMNRLNKMSKKLAEEQIRKSFDDEELMDEADNYKDIIGKEVEMDENFQRKIEDFKKSLHNKRSETKIEEKGGLIISSGANVSKEDKGNQLLNENLFDEIVNNISNPNFDIGNYNLINSVISMKKEERIVKNDFEIDFSTGGLQTFNRALDNIGSGATGGAFMNKKRDREVNRIYGVTKPTNRNVEETFEDEANDYDVIYNVGDKFGTEHDLNVNPYKKNEDNFDL